MLPVAEIGSAAFVIILYPRLDAIINYIFHSSFLTNHRFFLFQVDTGSFTRSIENCARPRSCRTAPPPSRPPRPTPRRRRWAVARAPDRAVPCWAACPVHLPRNRRTSTAIRRRACCRSFTSVTAGMPPTCSYCAPSAPPECWTLPRNCPATTRNGASRTGRYPPRTPASRTWSNTSRRRSNLSVSVRFVCVEYFFFLISPDRDTHSRFLSRDVYYLKNICLRLRLRENCDLVNRSRVYEVYNAMTFSTTL